MDGVRQQQKTSSGRFYTDTTYVDDGYTNGDDRDPGPGLEIFDAPSVDGPDGDADYLLEFEARIYDSCRGPVPDNCQDVVNGRAPVIVASAQYSLHITGRVPRKIDTTGMTL